MPFTETLRPDAAGDRTEATIGGDTPPANNWDCVDEVSANDATDYIITGTGASPDEDLYNLPATSIPAGSIIDSVAVHFRSREAGVGVVGTVAACIKENGVDTVGTARAQSDSWANFSQTWALRPSDGGRWTVADIGALQIGVRQSCTSGAAHTTQVYVVVSGRSKGWIIVVKPEG